MKIFEKRGKRKKFRAWKSVAWGIIAILLIMIIYYPFYHLYTRVQLAYALEEMDQFKGEQLTQVSDENEALKEKLERSAAYQTAPEVKSLSEWYIRKSFADEADRVLVVMNCESGLDPRRTHTNKDGSVDSGLYQIHDESTHRRNIEKMYGMPFELAVFDLEVSTKYAKFLWDRNPNNWVCNRIT